MTREITNLLRFLMDECLPPIIRDNRYFMYPFFMAAYRGRNIPLLLDFKKHVYDWNKDELSRFYKNLCSISRDRNTDLNKACMNKILQEVLIDTSSVLDLGSGNFHLLRSIQKAQPSITLCGVDLKSPKESFGIDFIQSAIEEVPIETKSYDTVLCTHVLEHVLDPSRIVEQMKRVAKKKIIIVVPKQRDYYYTLDEHVNFYSRKELLVAEVGLKNYSILNLRGDWLYVGYV